MGKYSKLTYSILIAISIWLQFSFSYSVSSKLNTPITNNRTGNSNTDLYYSLHLDSAGLSKDAFDNAVKGYNYLKDQGKLANQQTLSIIDFSIASASKRLFVIDLKNQALLFNTLVSHGRNSGLKTAQYFSNKPESFESSLGFYTTSSTYIGKHGYSLRLNGEEKGINDNAFSRGIVMHCAGYVNDKIAQLQGYIGRSEGCPALPENVYKSVIESIKGGSCLYIFSHNQYYTDHSTILNKHIG